MNQILYFIPGRNSNDSAKAVLPGRFEGSPSIRKVMSGPEGQPAGDVIAATDHRLAISLADQEWHQSACGKFWFGWWNDERPTSSDLLRKEPIAGTHCKSGWLIPRVRKHHIENGSVVYSIPLPTRAKWNGEYFEAGDIVQRYRAIADLGAEIHDAVDKTHRDAWSHPDQLRFLPEGAAELCGRIIQINHRVGMDELAALEAFELAFEPMNQILEIFVSRDQFHELLAQLVGNDGDAPEKKSALALV